MKGTVDKRLENASWDGSPEPSGRLWRAVPRGNQILALALGLVLVSMALAWPATTEADGELSGNWKLTTLLPTGAAAVNTWLIKLETKGGLTTGTLVSKNPTIMVGGLVSFTMKGGEVRADFLASGIESTFEGRLAKDGKSIVGVYSNDQGLQAAYMVPSNWTEIQAKDVVVKIAPEQLSKAVALDSVPAFLKTRALQVQDQEEKESLLKEAAKAVTTAEVEVPRLLRLVVSMEPTTFAMRRAAFHLLQRTKIAAEDSELKQWAELASGNAEQFGLIWKATVNEQIASALHTRKKAALAVPYAETAEKCLDASSSEQVAEKILTTLCVVLKDAGKTAEAATAAATLEKIEKRIDQQYLAKAPVFKAQPFAGRRKQSDRVVVMELFTGAECPDCVSSDAAFEVLQKTYKSSDLVLLQYHVHIPRPDPMTNSDTEARAKYYTATGTPTCLFNGKQKTTGGGLMGNAEKKYNDYCAIINPLLNEPAKVMVTATAKQSAGQVHISAEVRGLKDFGPDKKLRLVLAEEVVRFAGGNRVRFHHQVVRDMVGGPDGFAVTSADFSKSADVNLASLRTNLTSYLDDFAATKLPFPRDARPLDLQHLCVIAMVQDDSTHEILQAVQVKVAEH